MRFRKTFRRGSGRKRTVAWTDSLTFTNTNGITDRQAYTLTPSPGSNGAQAFLPLLIPQTLAEHGGEDCVLIRVVGDVHIIGGRLNSTPTSAFVHLFIAQKESNPDTGAVPPQNMFSFDSSAKDNILWDTTMWCMALPVAVPLIQPWPVSVHVDVRVSRKVQLDNMVYFGIGSAGGPGVTLINEVTLAGGLRVLLKRPR